jgi:hypothetical protein
LSATAFLILSSSPLPLPVFLVSTSLFPSERRATLMPGSTRMLYRVPLGATRQEFFSSESTSAKRLILCRTVCRDRRQTAAEGALPLWPGLSKNAVPLFHHSCPAHAGRTRRKGSLPREERWRLTEQHGSCEMHLPARWALFHAGVTAVSGHSGYPEQRRVIEVYGYPMLPRVTAAKSHPRRGPRKEHDGARVLGQRGVGKCPSLLWRRSRQRTRKGPKTCTLL